MIRTIDIHTHLLSPEVRFNRPLDRILTPIFAAKLGVSATELRKDPYHAYVSGMVNAVRSSTHVSKTCLFGVDAKLDTHGNEIHRDRTVCAYTEDVLKVAADYPDVFIPFMSVNPLRRNALDLLDEYIEQGCKGAKFLQNYWALDLNQARFKPYYEKLAANGLPLIIHIGAEYSLHSSKQYEQADMLYGPLEAGVNVIAAHMGMGRWRWRPRLWRNLSEQPDTFDPEHHQLMKMLRKYPNLYADLSAMLTPLRARALRHLADQTDAHEKLLFGSDYPVPFSAIFSSWSIPFEKRMSLGRIANPFDRYIALLSWFFGEGSPVYTNHSKLLPE